MRHGLAALVLIIATAAHAATYPPGYRWQTIETAHFLVHFHQGEEDLAQRAVAIAERAHARVVPLIGWTPQDRTHLILTDHVDASNGNATPFPLNRIEIYVSAPGADPSSAIEYYDNWLDLVITHEYTHIVHLDQARGFGAVTRRVFGRNPYFGFPNVWSPAWLIEGLATLTESELTKTGRLKGTFEEMILRTAAIEGRFATEAQASGTTPVWPGGGARYFYGSKFLSWLAQKEGADKLREYLQQYSSNVVPFRVNSTAEDVYGTSMKAMWRQWSDEQVKQYGAEHARLAAEGLTSHERLTRLGYETKYPLLSPDGTRIAYTHAGPYERPTIRVRDVATGREIATESVNSDSALSWSGDGKRIAYSQLEFVRTSSIVSDLYIWDVGGRSRRITHDARLKDPSFTPEGSLIAVENRAGRNRIVEVDVANGTTRPLVTPSGYTQFSEPAVSHDGRRIAVAEWNDGTIDVVLYERNGTRLANLTESLPHVTNASPRFSADDATIYFSSDVTGIPNVFAVPSAGGEIRRLTNVYGGALYPTTADGRRFFYSDYSSEGFDVAMFDAGRTYEVMRREIPRSVMGRGDVAEVPSAAEVVGTAPRSYSAWRSVRPAWWFPVIGESVGATTAGGDVLGFHSYAITATDDLYSAVYSYDRLYPTFSILAARFEESGDEITRRVLGEVSLPYRRYRWQASGSLAVLRDEIDIGTLQGFRLGASFNTARRFAYSVSEENGMTASASYENVDGDASARQIRGDLRGYLTIPYRRSPLGRHVLAVRVAAAQNRGDFIRQRELRIGGEEDVYRLPVRGYPSGILRGQRAEIASVEYRFPLYEIERGPATLPLFFNRLVGGAFIDAGRADHRSIASAGAEVGVDLVLGYGIPLRYRAGVAYLLRDPGKGDVQAYVGFGTSF